MKARPLAPMELSYIIQAKIEGVSPLTYAFNSAPHTIASLEDAARQNNHQRWSGAQRRMSLDPTETSELIGGTPRV